MKSKAILIIHLYFIIFNVNTFNFFLEKLLSKSLIDEKIFKQFTLIFLTFLAERQTISLGDHCRRQRHD
jgi:hypothetical protein